MTVLDDLRQLKRNDTIQATVDGEIYTFIVTDTEFDDPGGYSGYITVAVELKHDAYDELPDGFPTECGTIASDYDYFSDTFDTPRLEIWKPITAPDDDETVIVDDDWVILGDVTEVTPLGDSE